MRKIIKGLSALIAILCIMIFSVIIYADKIIPNEIFINKTKEIKLSKIFTVQFEKSEQTAKIVSNAKSLDEYQMNVSLLEVIPVKSSKIMVTERRYVVPSGSLFGIRLYTNGVVVVGTDEVATKDALINPAKEAGLQQGDIIVKVDGEKISSNAQISQAIQNSDGKVLKFSIMRNKKEKTLNFKPVLSSTDNKYKAGLWVRDSSAGVGTITFIDKQSKSFAGLGHAVCDIDTGEIMPLSSGDIVSASVNGTYKGKSGTTGELCGVFDNKVLGTLLVNGSTGVYGSLKTIDQSQKEIPVAMSYEVKEGPAQIISTINQKETKTYDIYIEKIYHYNNNSNKNMVIRVTDKELLEKTGGIVQGMSGSPIIQDGMLVGAVTHVFVNNPEKGYAIFAEEMINTMDKVNINNVAS